MKAIPLLTVLFAAPLVFAGSPPQADRDAILAMAGVFDVTFRFTEDAQLADEAEAVSEPYGEQALEVVVVAEDTPARITLQHLLVIGDSTKKEDQVIKHWSQVWTWEDTHMLDYSGSEDLEEWSVTKRKLEEAAGTWTQLVTNIDDAPRYEGAGIWRHRLGISTWTGADTRRPLPRREHTKRDDYDYLFGTNTHIVTKAGWFHQQDNLKIIDRGGEPQAIAHETGMNSYKRVESGRAEIAREWWREHGAAWDGIRAFWLGAIGETEGSFAYRTSADGNGISKTLGELVAAKADAAAIEAKLRPYLIQNKTAIETP